MAILKQQTNKQKSDVVNNIFRGSVVKQKVTKKH